MISIQKHSEISSYPRQWQRIFASLVKMLQTQQRQLNTLVEERKVMEERIKFQHNCWSSDVRGLENQILQVKGSLTVSNMAIVLEKSKSELLTSLKQNELNFYKRKLEDAQSDLNDLQSFLSMSSQTSKNKEKSCEEIDGRKEGTRELNTGQDTMQYELQLRNLKDEIKKLKHANEKVTSKNKSEVSALLAERNFVWHQFKKMEEEYTALLKGKRGEIEKMNEKMEILSKEKDATIYELKSSLARLENELEEQINHVAKLSRELEFLRNSRNSSLTEIENNRGSDLRNSRNLKSRRMVDRKWVSAERESTKSSSRLVKTAENKENKISGMKRKAIGSISMLESPRLFTSSFKVPKLKKHSFDSPR